MEIVLKGILQKALIALISSLILYIGNVFKIKCAPPLQKKKKKKKKKKEGKKKINK